MSPSEDLEVPFYSQLPSKPRGMCSGAGWSLLRGQGEVGGAAGPSWDAGLVSQLHARAAALLWNQLRVTDVRENQQGLENLPASLGVCCRQV